MMANGVLMGLIVITPVAGFVSPASAIVLGIICGPLFYGAEVYFGKRKWFSDPVGLLPGHLTGGLFGVLMIGFFSQNIYAAASGNASVPDGLFFGGGTTALHQLGIEDFWYHSCFRSSVCDFFPNNPSPERSYARDPDSSHGKS